MNLSNMYEIKRDSGTGMGLFSKNKNAGPYYISNRFQWHDRFGGNKDSSIPGSKAQRRAFDIANATYEVALVFIEGRGVKEIGETVRKIAKIARKKYSGGGGASFEKAIMSGMKKHESVNGISNLDILLEELRGPILEGSVIKDRLAIDRLSKLQYQLVSAAKKRGYSVLHHEVEYPKDDDWKIERVELTVSFKGKEGDLDGLIEDTRDLIKQIVKGRGEKKARSKPDPQAKVVDYEYSRPKGLWARIHFNTHVGGGMIFVGIKEVISTEDY